MNLYRLFEYMAWADEIVLAELHDLSENELMKGFGNYTTIKNRINLIAVTLEIWNERLNGFSPSPLPNYIKEKSDQIIAIWRTQSTKLQVFFSTPRNGEISYKNSNGVMFKDSIEDIAIHIINHTTAYRHQIVMMLRMMGKKVQNTEYLTYIRKIKDL